MCRPEFNEHTEECIKEKDSCYSKIAEKMNAEGYDVTAEYLKELDNRSEEAWTGNVPKEG